MTAVARTTRANAVRCGVSPSCVGAADNFFRSHRTNMLKETLDREIVLSVLTSVSTDLASLADASGARRRFDADIPQAFDDLEPQEFEAAREAIDAAREREQAESSGQVGFDAEENAGSGRRRG